MILIIIMAIISLSISIQALNLMKVFSMKFCTIFLIYPVFVECEYALFLPTGAS